MLLLDSLHGLFPEMTASVPEEMKFRLYVETLSQLKAADGRYIRWADVRMLRRIVRDMQFRNYSPRSTIMHWPLVRRAELRYIVPGAAPGASACEQLPAVRAPVMKARVQAALAPLIDEFRAGADDTQEAFERATRVQALFDQMPAVTDESVVPTRSLLREFIGGSAYEYH